MAEEQHSRGELLKQTAYTAPVRMGLDYPKRRSDISEHVVDGEMIILDRQKNLIHQLNQTASYIWDCCDGTSTIAAIITQLAEEFDVSLETAETDVVQVIDQLRQLNLLEAH